MGAAAARAAPTPGPAPRPRDLPEERGLFSPGSTLAAALFPLLGRLRRARGGSAPSDQLSAGTRRPISFRLCRRELARPRRPSWTQEEPAPSGAGSSVESLRTEPRCSSERVTWRACRCRRGCSGQPSWPWPDTCRACRGSASCRPRCQWLWYSQRPSSAQRRGAGS